MTFCIQRCILSIDIFESCCSLTRAFMPKFNLYIDIVRKLFEFCLCVNAIDSIFLWEQIVSHKMHLRQFSNYFISIWLYTLAISFPTSIWYVSIIIKFDLDRFLDKPQPMLSRKCSVEIIHKFQGMENNNFFTHVFFMKVFKSVCHIPSKWI